MNLKVKAVKTAAAAGIILSMCTGVAFASIGSATVTADSLRMRSGAGTDSAVVTQAPKGAQVSVEEDAGNGWYKVTYGGKTGYMSGEWLSVSLTDGTIIQDEPTPQASEPEQQRGLITASVLNVRSGPDTTYDKVATLRGGMVVDIVADTGSGWYQIESGYVSAEYMVSTTETVGTVAPTVSSNSAGSSIVALAKQFLGCPYVYGASGPNAFDCSGFTSYVYRQVGISIPHGATSQYRGGTPVSRENVQPGDLVFIADPAYCAGYPISHVGIYIGNGQFIHASSNRGEGVTISNIFTGHYGTYYAGARRYQ